MTLGNRLFSYAATMALVTTTAIAACSSGKTRGDAGTDASGGGGQSAGAGGQAGEGGGPGGSGGQVDAGSCRLQGESCVAPQRCCGALICAGICTMGVSSDAGGDANLTCSYPDGGAPPDGGAFDSICPAAGCPTGTVCVAEVGGVAGGGGEYCAPIPIECHGTPTCACMGSCVCTNGFGGRPEACNDQNGSIACDNGIR